MPYEPRESIQPRPFALRHMLLEQLKLRLQRMAEGTSRAHLVALARALDVSYDDAARCFIVRGIEGASCEVPFEAVRLFQPRTDAAAAAWEREDEILRANRALADRVIDQLSSVRSRGEAS